MEAVDRSCSVKKVFLKKLQNSENTWVRVSYIIKLRLASISKSCDLQLYNKGLQLYQKETPVQMASCEICEICKNPCFTEHLRGTAFVHY